MIKGTDKTDEDKKLLAAQAKATPSKNGSLSPAEKELRNIILKANAVDAEYFTPVVSEYFDSYNNKKKKKQP